jgi:uroporphyrinogen decarboxylase
VHQFAWPDPDDYDFSGIAGAIAAAPPDRPIQGGSFQLIREFCELRGLEQALMDFAMDDGIVDAIMGRLFDFHYEMNRRIFEAARGKIDLFFMSSDLGSQIGPLISLEHFRRFFRPRFVKMAELAHRFGARIFFHSDGAIAPFIPDLMDVVGIDALNPVQWRCPGMAREELARLVRDRIVLHGAVDNQHTLPFGAVQDVKDEVRRTREIFRNCRWIVCSCHNVQAGTPVENVLAMYEAARELS